MDKGANMLKFIAIISIFFFTGCAPQRPVLYPNAYLKHISDKKAQADIDECMRLANKYGAKENVPGRIVKDTASSAAVGAAAGAAISAVLGGNVGRSAGAGAAGAGAATLTKKTIDSGEPGQVFRRFVEKCLRDKGYETTGWR